MKDGVGDKILTRHIGVSPSLDHQTQAAWPPSVSFAPDLHWIGATRTTTNDLRSPTTAFHLPNAKETVARPLERCQARHLGEVIQCAADGGSSITFQLLVDTIRSSYPLTKR